jgi:hypothetical protein
MAGGLDWMGNCASLVITNHEDISLPDAWPEDHHRPASRLHVISCLILLRPTYRSTVHKSLVASSHHINTNYRTLSGPTPA